MKLHAARRYDQIVPKEEGVEDSRLMEEMMTTDEVRSRLHLHVARKIELHAALIVSAQDPLAMLELLRPLITDPNLGGGKIPAIYTRLAAGELRRRAGTPITSCTLSH